MLVVQLSDLHFNEVVDLPSNRYDFTVASQRLAKLAQRIKQLGRAMAPTRSSWPAWAISSTVIGARMRP